MSVMIKDIPVNDRPRERLRKVGISNLSNEEIISLIIRTGTKDNSVKDLSNLLFKEIKNIKYLNDITLDELLKIKGFGISKASSLLACIELGKRINNKIDNINDMKFTNPNIIYEYYKNKIGHKKQEYFYTIYLDSSKRIIKEKLLFIGTINQSIVHPREVFKEAYLCDATSIICVHNHPSGSIFPSKEDIKLTKKLIEIGNTFGIAINDHIIIASNKYYSFYENGDM